MAEALVEGMFMRAGYAVSRVGRESQVQRLFSVGKDAFLPDFMIRKAVERGESERPLHRLIPIEVKYRHDIASFLRRYGSDFLKHAKSWPDLYLVFVTDDPEPGRSYFQVMDCAGGGCATEDLDKVRALDIYSSTVAEYGNLARKLFALLEPRQ